MTGPGHSGLHIILAASAQTAPDCSSWQAPLCGRSTVDWLLDTVVALHPEALLVVGDGSAEVHDAARSRPELDQTSTADASTAGASTAGASTAGGSGRPGVTAVISCRYPLLLPATVRRAIRALAQQAQADSAFCAVLIRAVGTATWWSEPPDDAVAAVVYAGRADSCPDWLARSALPGTSALLDQLHDLGAQVAVIDAGPVESLCADDPVDRQQAATALYQRIAVGWQRRGVIIEDPATTRIDATVRVGRGTVIRPHTELTGATVVGAGASIGPITRLADTTAGDKCVIRYAVCERVTIGDSANIGPFTWLRSGTRLGARTRAGSFVELADSVIGDGTQFPHVGGLLGAVVGKNCNIAGLSGTANFDGQGKHQVKIGDNVSIGASNMLIAPLTIGDGAYTAAGSIITEDVPGGALAIARGKQVNIDGWVARKGLDTSA